MTELITEDTGKLTKQMLWERKLLDFSLRNNLLNTKLGRKVVPFISFEIEHLEDRLQNGEDFFIIPAPGKRIEPLDNHLYDSPIQAVEHKASVIEFIANHKIVSYLSETELQNALKFIYRAARTSFEENGANSLFLTLGMLKWYETDKSELPRFAPILLLPVDIVRRSASNYIIRKRDEDIILNITLVELLKQNFRISLEALKELPKDESGVDVKLIFSTIRSAIKEQKRWAVQEESMLGLFSFNKFVMWNDIHSNAGKLQENVIVSSLINNCDKQEPVTDVVDARDIDKANAPMDFAIPLDVDSSQMEAIVESGKGRTFILHGPPGTGKSQTITNMIANALYQGRRVLFVAEKMAALSVVQSRLEKIGLAPFCLELHSNKATKKHFLEQMDEVLKVTKIKSSETYGKLSEELFQERKELISYMEALHQKAASGLSLYDSISDYLSIGDEEITEGLPELSIINTDYIAQCRNQIEQVEAVLHIVGQPSRHPLYGLEPVDNRQETLDVIFRQLQTVDTQYHQLLSQLKQLEAKTTLHLETDADMTWLEKFHIYVSSEKARDELRETILANYSEEILRLDVTANRQEWENAKAKWFIPRFFAKRSYVKSLQRYGQIFESSIDDILQRVDDYQHIVRQLKEEDEVLTSEAAKEGFSHADRREAYLSYLGQQQSLRRTEFLGDAKAIVAIHQQLIRLTADLNTRFVRQCNKQELTSCSGRWMEHQAEMKDWYHWVDKKRELNAQYLLPVIPLLEAGVSPRTAIKGFLKGLYHQLIVSTIDENPQLRMFNGLKFRQQIEKYKRDTARFQELSKEELYSKLASRIPATSAVSAEGSEISILKRNITNGGRGNSIRSIIDSIPTLLPRLCPCMLMSPISVAQYIDLNNEKFDLVIFDEASQMPTSEAVGAIARGKALIVVGDSKQMPPTSFFTTTQVDEEEADIDDMESILDDCITLSLCEHQLKWHYRSKHESLIAFSNSQYYDNNLFTFPSIDDHVAKVKLVPVEGVYDKGRTRSNPQESQAIVKEILRRLADPELRDYSIGVVSFSKVQGDLIEDDLTEALDKHPELKELAYNAKEPIFVKNLENVQGDERDVILFSIGYGADESGKVSMNFGPLNNAGGERRLNVAVSRARYEMIVYSTLKASQIDLRRSHAKGVEGLKGFLEFAETGNLPASTATSQQQEKNIMAEQICKALQEQGYLTESSVGRSNFKVDIAVSTPEHPEKFILGILCDGKTYYETKTTRDREIVQPGVLQMLHWRVLRVYSVDWYENRERTLSQILDVLKAPESDYQPHITPKTTYGVFAPPSKPKAEEYAEELVRNAGMLPYNEAVVEVNDGDKEQFNPQSPAIVKVIRQIVEAEQPITEAYLCKRLAKVLGFGHAGANFLRAVQYASPRLYRDPHQMSDVITYWLDKKSASDYHTYRTPSPRTLNEIPAIELANAITEVLDEEFSLPKEKIPTLAIRKLGFSNAGAKSSEIVHLVIDMLEAEGVVKNRNGLISKNES